MDSGSDSQQRLLLLLFIYYLLFIYLLFLIYLFIIIIYLLFIYLLLLSQTTEMQVGVRPLLSTLNLVSKHILTVIITASVACAD